jgi:predicted dehydrogenase
MNRERLGVAVIGLGIGERHARAYHADPRCRLRWVYDHNPDRANVLAVETGACTATAYEEILADDQVQIVSLATYDDDHARMVIQALKAGKHVFVEKPLCQTMEQLQEIKQLWSTFNGKLKLASNLILRAAPVYQWLKKRLAAGDFGRIYSFDGEYLYGRLSKLTGGWRSQVENYSIIEGGGIHMIDLMLWLIEERPETVFSMGNRISTEGTGFRYNDFAACTLQMPSGLVARIVANFSCVHRHQHVVRVYGTKGTFLYDDMGARIHWTRDEAVSASPLNLPALPADKGELIPAFVSAVLYDEDIRGQTQAVFDGLRISAACDRALQTNGLETVRYL